MSLTRSDDWRIGSYRPKIIWSLKKRTGTKTATVDQYLQTDTVVMTYVTAKVDVVKQYVTQGGKIRNETVRTRIIDGSYQNLLSKRELRIQLKTRNEQKDDDCQQDIVCTMSHINFISNKKSYLLYEE